LPYSKNIETRTEPPHVSNSEPTCHVQKNMEIRTTSLVKKDMETRIICLVKKDMETRIICLVKKNWNQELN